MLKKTSLLALGAFSWNEKYFAYKIKYTIHTQEKMNSLKYTRQKTLAKLCSKQITVCHHQAILQKQEMFHT